MMAEVLLAGFGGALAVFVLGLLREWWRNERERRGLLRLLLAEIQHNAEVIATIEDRRPDPFDSPDLPLLKADTWRGAQARTAQLLSEELTRVLNGYYASLEMLLTLLRFANRTSDEGDRRLRASFKELNPDKKVAATRNPYRDYLGRMRAAQDVAQAQIRGYLELSWGENLLLASVRLID